MSQRSEYEYPEDERNCLSPMSAVAYFFPAVAVSIPGVLHIIQSQNPTTDVPGIGALGIGGILATWAFWLYRKDREASESRYAKTVEKLDVTIDKNTQSQTETAKALMKLTDAIETGDTFSRIRAILERDKE